jgi:hypothetical protein
MNIKQIAGVTVFAVGIFFIGYGVSSKHHLSSAKEEIQKMAESKNPLIRYLGRNFGKTIGQYGTHINLFLLGGGCLVVVGSGIAYFCRTRKT